MNLNRNHLVFEVKVDADGFTVSNLFIKPLSLPLSLALLGFDVTISASSLNHHLPRLLCSLQQVILKLIDDAGFQ